MRAVKAQEILFTAENKVGMLEVVSKQLKDAGVNIRAISAWEEKDKAKFRLVTSDNLKAKSVLSELGPIEEREIIIVEMPDQVGQLNQLALNMKDAGINLGHIYATASMPNAPVNIVLSTDNNIKAIEALSQ